MLAVTARTIPSRLRSVASPIARRELSLEYCDRPCSVAVGRSAPACSRGTRAYASVSTPRPDFPVVSHEASVEFIEGVYQSFLRANTGETRSCVSEDELRRRLDAFQDLLAEARQCIEDCADSAETSDFDQEAVAARDAVEEACSVYADILEDLEGAEKTAKRYPYGVVKKSELVRRLQGLKIDKLKGELTNITRNWRPPLREGSS
uniref:Uncharacterized protein n=1 Tax=Trieres chinensis TaxID=1514140 RepID=A0A7S2EME2_TRICV|mmetsp:Transcript_3080/g.6626  ORF Transcript_3080/g.6626 Transcript_3080/m.6626 type:complete len:206 (+) Transcript_3080:85-702(+)